MENQTRENAIAATEEGRFDDVIRLLKEINDPDEETLLLLAQAYEAQDEVNAAEFAYKRAIAMGSVNAAVNLGVLYWDLGEDDLAEATYRGVAGKSELARENLALLLRDTGRYTEATQAMQAMIRAGKTQWHNELGELLWNSNDLNGAETEFRRGLKEGDERSPCFLGHFLWRTGRAQEAEAVFRSALESGNDAVLFDYALMLSESEDRLRDAVKLYRRATDDEAKLNLALLYWKLDEIELSREAFEQSIAIPDPDAFGPYADFLDMQGEHDAAVEMRQRGAVYE